MRKLASIQRIVNLKPIEGADRIECAQVLGWQCVVGKGEFKVGDLVIYLEVDSVTPQTHTFKLLAASNYRVKTRRFKKQISQGLCLPLQPTLAEKYFPLCEQLGVAPLPEGMDLTEILKIEKWEVYNPAQLAGTVKGSFPEFLHKTDEERIQGYPGVLERHKGFTFSMSEKLDGTSFTCYLNENTFGVCSRNLELKEDDSNTYWKVAKALNLKERLEKLGGNWALQGELIGQGIQKNKYLLPDVQLKLFNIFNIDTRKYLDQDEFVKKARWLNLDTVPMLGEIPLNHTVDDLIELAEGPSMLNPKIPREGIVFRPEHEAYDEDLGRLSWKILNPIYLLEQED